MWLCDLEESVISRRSVRCEADPIRPWTHPHSPSLHLHRTIHAHDGLADKGELHLAADLGELLGVIGEDAEVLGVDIGLALCFGVMRSTEVDVSVCARDGNGCGPHREGMHAGVWTCAWSVVGALEKRKTTDRNRPKAIDAHASHHGARLSTHPSYPHNMPSSFPLQNGPARAPRDCTSRPCTGTWVGS